MWRLHGHAGNLAVARADGAADDVVVVVAVGDGVGEVLGAADGVDEEVAHVPHAFAELRHHAAVGHVVDDEVELAVEEAVAAGAGGGVCAVLEVGDALPGGVELGELCVGASKGGGSGDLALEPAEEVEEVEDLLGRVAATRQPLCGTICTMPMASRRRMASMTGCLETPNSALTSSIEMRDPAGYWPAGGAP